MQHTRRGRRALMALLATMALVATACGGSGDSTASDDGATPEAPAETTGEATSGEAAESEGLVLMDEEIADADLWQAAQDEGTITLYTALSEARELAILERYKEDTGLDVDVVRLGGGRLFERVMSEHGADLLGADVIRQTDVTLAQDYQEAGVWEPYCHPFWELSDPELQEEDCHYWTSQQPVYAIGYNTELVDEADAPQSWEDLLDPKWKGNIGLAHIGAGGSTWARDLFLRNEFGVEYWEALAAQEPFITGAAGAVTEGNARGEFAVAMVLPGSQGIAAADGAPLEIVMPSDGVPTYSQWLGLAANAEKPNAAKVFLNWNMSLAGQTAIAEAAGDYPVREDAPGPTAGGVIPLPKRTEVDLRTPELTEEYETERDAYMEEWFSIFGYTPEA